MTTKTLGTTTTTALTAITWAQASAGILPADLASVSENILDDLRRTRIVKGMSTGGVLTIPRRGVLKVLPGDYVAIDSQGWPVLISAYSIAHGPWVSS